MISIRLIPRTGTIKKAERRIITARDTEATYFDKNGILQTAAPYEVRYTKNFETGKQDLLLEPESTNTFYYNGVQGFGYRDGVDITTQNIRGIAFFKIVRNSTENYTFFRKRYFSDNDINTFSFFVQKSSYKYIGIRRGIEFSVFDQDQEKFIKTASNNLNQGFIDLGGDMYRLWGTFENDGSNINSTGIISKTGNGYNIGSEGDTIIVGGFQLEAGANLSSYIQAKDKSTARAADKLVFAT